MSTVTSVENNQPTTISSKWTWLGWLHGVFSRACKVVIDVMTSICKTAGSALSSIADRVQAAFQAVGKKSGKLGVNRHTILLSAGTVGCLVVTATLLTVGLPTLIVPVVCLLALLWLLRDAWNFLRNHPSGEALAEAILRLSAVVCVGTVVLAAMCSSPCLGALACSLIITGMLYKFLCSDAGRYEIEQRWQPPMALPVAS